MSRFITRPKILYDPHTNKKRPWLLESDCLYQTDVPESPTTVFVPAGYRTDLASVPRIPGIYWRVGNRAVLPSIVHDYLFEKNPYHWTRKQADQIFWEAMADERDPPWGTTRWLMYAGVRVGSGFAWRNYRRNDDVSSVG